MLPWLIDANFRPLATDPAPEIKILAQRDFGSMTRLARMGRMIGISSRSSPSQAGQALEITPNQSV